MKPNEDIETNNQDDEEKNFKKEIDFLSLMKHPNIVQFIGWTVWMNKKAIVMEFMHTSLQSGKIYFDIFCLFF